MLMLSIQPDSGRRKTPNTINVKPDYNQAQHPKELQAYSPLRPKDVKEGFKKIHDLVLEFVYSLAVILEAPRLLG